MAKKTTKTAPVEEVKTEAVAEKKAEKAAPKKKAAAKPKKETAAKAAPEVKAEPKATETKDVKKAAPKAKTTAKKTAEKPVSVQIQLASGNYSPDEIVEKCKESYKDGKRKVIRTIEVYVKADESKAYYVVNGKAEDENGNSYFIDL